MKLQWTGRHRYKDVHADIDYATKAADFDSIWLLQVLQKINAGANKTTNKYFSAFKATKMFYVTQQHNNKGVYEYYCRFENAKDLVQLFDADVVDIVNLLKYEQIIDVNSI